MVLNLTIFAEKFPIILISMAAVFRTIVMKCKSTGSLVATFSGTNNLRHPYNSIVYCGSSFPYSIQIIMDSKRRISLPISCMFKDPTLLQKYYWIIEAQVLILIHVLCIIRYIILQMGKVCNLQQITNCKWPHESTVNTA